jgi:hypothetical protein
MALHGVSWLLISGGSSGEVARTMQYLMCGPSEAKFVCVRYLSLANFLVGTTYLSSDK